MNAKIKEAIGIPTCYRYTDESGNLRIRTGRMDTEKMYGILKRLYKGKKDAEICRLLNVADSCLYKIHSGERKGSFSDDVLKKLFAQAGRCRIRKQLEPEILDANGIVKFTGVANTEELYRLAEVIMEERGLSVKKFCRESGLPSSFGQKISRTPLEYSTLQKMRGGIRGWYMHEASMGLLLKANYCSTKPVAKTSAKKAAEPSVKPSEKTEKTVARPYQKRKGLPQDAVVNFDTTAKVSKAISTEMIDVVRGMILFGRDTGMSDSEMDDMVGRINKIATDSSARKVLAAYRSMRLTDADEGTLSVTKDELQMLAKVFVG